MTENPSLTPLLDRLDALRRHRPRITRRQALHRLAVAEHRLEVRDDAYRRLLADNGHRGERARLAEELVNTVEGILKHPSSQGHPDAVVEHIAAHLGSYRRAVEESELYHGAMSGKQ